MNAYFSPQRYISRRREWVFPMKLGACALTAYNRRGCRAQKTEYSPVQLLARPQRGPGFVGFIGERLRVSRMRD